MRKKEITTTLIVTTYNRPDALEAVLESVRTQVWMPDEVIVADDGSRDETRSLIKRYMNDFPTQLHHCWQEDRGFRLSEIRNKAILQSKCDYIIMIDGDMVLNRNFVRDHISLAKPGHFIQGSRVLLSQKNTENYLHNNVRKTLCWYSKGIKNRMNAVSCKSLMTFVSDFYGEKGVDGVRGCNMSYWKADVEKVNGFNQEFVGWGREDSEFVVRMLNSGIQRINAKFGCVGFHLWHPENKPSDIELIENDKRLAEAEKAKVKVCENGLRHISDVQ